VAPRDEREIAVLRHAWQQFDHVSFERLLSGPGLELIYRALADHAGVTVDALPATEITRRAQAGSDAVAVETLDVYCALLGTAAADLALTLGATGGIYIGGGIVPRLGELFDRSRFRARFEDKGRFGRYLAAIPTFVVTHEQATFVGASAILDSQLKAMKTTPGATILGQIRRACSELSPAELRVAEHVLAQPRTVINQPIADIAKAAQVSQPTVIRFCRSLGCEGLSDFKLRLASGLTGTLPISHVQVTNDDSMVELGTKVLGNSASAILQLRSQLNRDMIDRSIDLLVAAQRVELCAIGPYGAVTLDAQYKFLRLGMAAGAHADPRLQLLAVGVLQPGDVAVLVSASGRLPELLEVADRARERGAAVVAITASQSPLARKADTVLAVDHVEDGATQVAMIGRILQLLMVDILTVGVAMRRLPAKAVQPLDGGSTQAAQGSAMVREAEGDSAASVWPANPASLAHMTPHSG
jgi:glucokinase